MSAVQAPVKSSLAAPNFTSPIINSVRNVFAKMVKVEVTVDPPREKTVNEPARDVSAVIGLSGDISGTVIVSFDMSAATNLIGAFAPYPIEPASLDFIDAVGELANMIAGGAKKDFGVDVNISVPSVVIGTGHPIAVAECVVPGDSVPYADRRFFNRSHY